MKVKYHLFVCDILHDDLHVLRDVEGTTGHKYTILNIDLEMGEVGQELFQLVMEISRVSGEECGDKVHMYSIRHCPQKLMPFEDVNVWSLGKARWRIKHNVDSHEVANA